MVREQTLIFIFIQIEFGDWKQIVEIYLFAYFSHMETDIFFNFSFISIATFNMALIKVKSIIWYPASTRLSVDQSSWSKDDSDAANMVVYQYLLLVCFNPIMALTGS